MPTLLYFNLKMGIENKAFACPTESVLKIEICNG
jgi:hypothetical protein